MNQIKERCIYCGSDVYYNGTETLIKCGMCGHTLVVAKFENELAKMNAALEEGEQAKKELDAAKKEKEAADDRLFAALSDFDALKDGQNAALRVLYALSDGQENASEKLDLLQHFSGRILETQDDIMGKLQMQTEIAARLQTIEMDTDHRNQMLSDFMLWCQTARAEDMKALEDLSSSASALLEGQKVIDEKVERLQQTVYQTQHTIVSFQSEYQSDKINELRRLFDQASEDQIDRAYDKAMDKYEQAIVKGGPDPEILWRMILCHYCISYQQDGDGDMIPIILNPDLRDPDELKVRREFSKQVLEGSNTSAEERRVYTDELIKIDQILDNYRQVRHDWQFDVFISVKQSSDGQYTPDRNVGLDLCDFLTSKGLRVFNSERTELPAGELYEPYIISALLSSKVMIVVGTCTGNMESQWVKNEWSRFQWLQYHEKKQTGKTDRVLLCYLAKGMQPGEIPHALDPDRQAIVEGVDSARMLLSALQSILPQEKKTEKIIPINGTQDISNGSAVQTQEPLEQVLTQMTVMLTLGEYKQVIEKHTQLRFTAPYMSDPRFHLYALCAEKQVDEIGRLSELKTDLNKERLFKLAVKLSKGTDLQMYLEKLTQTPSDLSVEETDFAVNWKDDNLEKAMREVTGITGRAIMYSDVRDITKLDLTGKEIKNISSLKALRNLESLSLVHNKISDISSLKDLKNLETLDLWGNEISDISSLKDLINLKDLDIGSNEFSDISSLRDLTNLKDLELSDNEISNISILKDLTNLESLSLDLYRNEDISILKNLTNLKSLFLTLKGNLDISILKYLTNLETLNLSDNEISDISSLKALTNLKDLDLNYNKISDISALKNLTKLKRLALRGNPITDYSPIKGLNIEELSK